MRELLGASTNRVIDCNSRRIQRKRILLAREMAFIRLVLCLVS